MMVIGVGTDLLCNRVGKGRVFYTEFTGLYSALYTCHMLAGYAIVRFIDLLCVLRPGHEQQSPWFP